jgi:hypothetical protein
MAKEKPKPIEVTDENVEDLYDRFLKDKMLVEGAEERLAKLKAGLLIYAEQNGMRDDNGHLWVRLGNDHVFKRQLSRRETLNEGRIRTWLNEVGREAEVEKTVVVFDEDKFWEIVDEEELSAKQIDSFYDVKEIYSFISEAG